MKIKICGLKTIEDSLAACEAGADMLGFNFYPKSVRHITPQKCRGIVAEVKAVFAEVACVGIFVNHEFEDIKDILNHCHLDLAQLSGNEPVDLLEKLGENAFKAIRPRSLQETHSTIEQIPTRASAPAFLLDSYHSNAYGGTGKGGNWELGAQISGKHPFILAGGLNPENIARAITCVQPWGVDVASGVELVRGEKDIGLIQAFISQARTAVQQMINESTI